MTTVDLLLDQSDVVALLTRQTGILEQIASGGALGGVLTDITSAFEELVPGSHCSVLLLDRESGTLRHGAAPSLSAAYSAQIDGMAIGADAGSCGTAAFTGQAVVVADIRTDARWVRFRDLAADAGLRACWSTPIRGRHGTCGTFAVYHEKPHLPSAREEHLVARLTHLASVAIDHDAVIGALAASEERFRRAFDDNAVGMALTTPDAVITRVNAAMATLLGRPEATLVGSRLDEVFVPPHVRPGPCDHEEYEATTHTLEGRRLDVVVAVSPICGADGAPRALSVNVLDVTGQRAAERERRGRVEAELATAAAEAANRAKTDFVSALGHELRTPLQAITGFTELLGTLDLDTHRRVAALHHISGAADHILRMVGEVLDVSRIEARSLPLTLRDVDLALVVADVLAMTEHLACAERVSVRVRATAASVGVHADERRVRQVLLNVVTNAIRYNRVDGHVHIGWGSRGGAVQITVRDTGQGIPAEHLDRLFVPFDRLGRDSDEGVGLGLPLARGLAEAMGGSLGVHSRVGEGTMVVVSLPAAAGLVSRGASRESGAGGRG